MQFQPIQTVKLYRVSQSKKETLQLVHSTLILSNIQWGLFLCPRLSLALLFLLAGQFPPWGDKGSDFCEYSASTWQRRSKKFHYVTGWNNLYMSWFGEMCKCGRSSLNLKIINGAFSHGTQTSCSALVSRRLEQAPRKAVGWEDGRR